MHNSALGLLLLRLTIGGLMLFHGVSKVMHPQSLNFISGKLQEANFPEILAYGVYVGEILAPAMIILGVMSRIGGLLISVNMIFAIYLAHSTQLFMLGKHGAYALEVQAFYLLGGLCIFLLGSGSYALRRD